MARTAAVALSTTTPKVGQRVPGIVTVSSTDANPVMVTDVQVYVSNNQPVVASKPEVGGGGGAVGFGSTKPTVINNGGSIAFPFDIVAAQPQVPGATAIAYTVNAAVTFSDGTVVSASTATLTVSPLS